MASVSDQLRKDKGNIPYVSIAYDGQEDSSIELRLQAFMHQAHQYCEEHDLHNTGLTIQKSRSESRESIKP